MENVNDIKQVKNNETLPFKVKLGYGSTGYAAIMTLSIFIVYGMFFLTDVVGLSASFAGVILSIGTLWDAITDPLVGRWSDHRDPKKGRRRPFLKWVAVPFGLVAWLLFTDFNLSPAMAKVYFITIAIAFYTVQTLLDVPYTALGAEMTMDYDERSSLNSNRNFFATISGILSAFTMTLVFYFADTFGSLEMGWSMTGGLFALIAIVTIYIGYKSTEGYELESVQIEEKHNQVAFLKDVLRNKVFRYTTGLFAFSLIGLTIQNSAIIYYFIYYLNLSEIQISTAMLSAWLPGIIWVPVINYMSQKMSKKFAWNVCMGLWAFGTAIMILFVLTESSSFVLVCLAQIFVGIGLVSQYQIVWSMIPDIVEVDEFMTGLRREGSYYGLIAFVQKALTAFTMLVSGMVLTGLGYIPNQAQSIETLNGMKIWIAVGGGIFLVLSMVVASLNPMTRERHSALLNAIEAKKEGKEYSTDGFSELL